MWNRKAAASGLTIAAVVFAGACSDVPLTEPIAPEFDAASLFRSPSHNPHSYDGTLDAAFVRIAQQTLGFGGYFYDEAGTLNVYMKGAQALSSSAASSIASLGADVTTQSTNVLVGQYDFIELAGMRSRADAVLGLQGVVFTDIDEAANRVRIGVENDAVAANVEHALDMLGIERDAVLISQMDPIVTMQTLQSRVRPVAGSLQINWPGIPGFVCTLGFNVRSPDAPNVHGFVTNSHCTNERGVVTNTPYYQHRQDVADTFIGTEVHDLPFFTGGACPVGRVCRWSDSAGGRYAPGIDNAFARLYRTTGVNNLSLTIDPDNPMFSITAERPFPNVGDTMHKVGRTTGWTSGTVTGSCVNANVSGTNITMLCQEIVENPANPIVAGGDSGSPVFDNIVGNNVRLVGILWGGAGANLFVFSAMNEVRFENVGPLPWRTFPAP